MVRVRAFVIDAWIGMLLVAGCASPRPSVSSPVAAPNRTPSQKPVVTVDKNTEYAAKYARFEHPDVPYDSKLESPHFEIHWRARDASESDAKQVRDTAEGALDAYRRLLGEKRLPTKAIRIGLEGDGSAARMSPFVSWESGTIHLFKYQGPRGGYEGVLPHELVHAIRFHLWPHDANPKAQFVEEGFAEFLALESGLGGQSFPLYGYPLDLVAGSVTASGDLDLVTLTTDFTANFRCLAQAYPIRASFFGYLKERFGFDRVAKYAYTPPAELSGVEREIFGEPLDALEKSWSAWAKERFLRGVAAQERADEYWTKSAIRYLPKCTAK